MSLRIFVSPSQVFDIMRRVPGSTHSRQGRKRSFLTGDRHGMMLHIGIGLIFHQRRNQ